MSGLPELDPKCVFCPGNENKNPDLCNDTCRIPNNPNWEVRVIPNKFPALEQTTVYRRQEFYNSRSGYGEHEVLVTRKHNEPIALQSVETVELSLNTIAGRIKELDQNSEIGYVQAFHNHGRDAGASVIHPHYQIMATPMVPPHIHAEMQGCYHYYQENKKCIYCEIIAEEIKLNHRLVYETEHFAVISAYASRSPFETWILPKKHGARFQDITPQEMKHLAFTLKVTLGKLYTKLSDPSLNFYIHSMPTSDSVNTLRKEESYHWHLTIFPRLTIWAGFEFATGIPVNPMPPEVTAKFLRGD
jgi:UDPglucose--hexose-1-phosphate uridylyltransferase